MRKQYSYLIFFYLIFLLIVKFYLYFQEICDKQCHVICKQVWFGLNFHMHIFRCTLTSPVYYLLLKVSLILMMNKIMNVMNIALLRTADICNGMLSFLLINCQIKIIPEKIAVVIILGRAHNFKKRELIVKCLIQYIDFVLTQLI